MYSDERESGTRSRVQYNWHNTETVNGKKTELWTKLNCALLARTKSALHFPCWERTFVNIWRAFCSVSCGGGDENCVAKRENILLRHIETFSWEFSTLSVQLSYRSPYESCADISFSLSWFNDEFYISGRISKHEILRRNNFIRLHNFWVCDSIRVLCEWRSKKENWKKASRAYKVI